VLARILPWALALVGAAIVLMLGAPTEDVYWSDFNNEGWPAFERLIGGDLQGFLTASPVAYAGSMLLRAPFAALAGALGFDSMPAIYRAGALPCLLALAVLAVHLARRARQSHPQDRWWLLVLGLAGASPVAWMAVWYGHPEELLASALAVGAVLTALNGRAVLAGALLGAAIVSKQWAVLAILPCVLAAPRHQFRLLATAAGTAAAALLPVMLADPGAYAVAQQSISSSAQWFRPRQLWWPLGAPPPAGMGAPAGAAVTPDWLVSVAKPLIVALSVPLSALWLRRRRAPADALLLLALLMLARCVLDPWNMVYYHLPLVIALLAWEVATGRRIPVLALASTAAVWLTFNTYDPPYGYAPWLVYLAWTLPLAAHLAYRLYRPTAPQTRLNVAAPATA
jgi:glycosyl transferase family 87